MTPPAAVKLRFLLLGKLFPLKVRFLRLTYDLNFLVWNL